MCGQFLPCTIPPGLLLGDEPGSVIQADLSQLPLWEREGCCRGDRDCGCQHRQSFKPALLRSLVRLGCHEHHSPPKLRLQPFPVLWNPMSKGGNQVAPRACHLQGQLSPCPVTPLDWQKRSQTTSPSRGWAGGWDEESFLSHQHGGTLVTGFRKAPITWVRWGTAEAAMRVWRAASRREVTPAPWLLCQDSAPGHVSPPEFKAGSPEDAA